MPGTERENGDAGHERHEVRLAALLHQMVRERRLKGAADTLGLDPRTVQTSLDRGELSELVRMALERHVLAERGERAARQRERIDALERRMDALETELTLLPSGAGDGDGARGKEQASGNRQAEAGPVPGSETRTPAPAATQPSGPERIGRGRRRYPELVFVEPEHDDREVYGDAWPLVEEWRLIWQDGHRGTGKGLAWLRTDERVRTLEVAMLEEHGLTLPPQKTPLYGLDRRDQLVWRKETLSDVRRSLARAERRAWLRRKLTFGRWRD